MSTCTWCDKYTCSGCPIMKNSTVKSRDEMKWTVFFMLVPLLIWSQVKAKTAGEAEAKAEKLYREHFSIEEGWIEEADGEDK